MTRRIEELAKSLTRYTAVVGTISLLWLMLRTGTKPSRIVYPCQRAAAKTSYTLLLYPLVASITHFEGAFTPYVYSVFSDSKRRNTVILVSLLASSILLSGLTVYVYLLADPVAVLRNRSTLTDRLTLVSVERIKDGRVEDALEAALNGIGGIESIVPEGSKVIIKPNVVRNQKPPDTIDPSMVKALINIIGRRNPSVIWVAEGSGEGNTTENMRALGYFPTVEAPVVKVVDLNYGEMVNVTVPRGGVIFQSFILNHVLVEADIFISVACLKTHDQAVVTLGMKNLVGLAPGSFYGFPKGVLHQTAAAKQDDHLAGVIVDLCNARKIDLVIIDGRVGMEGQGPHNGTPVKLDLVIVGRDPVATDSIASALMGFDPEKVPTLNLAREKGLGTNDLHRIEVRGERLEDVFHQFIPASGHESYQIFPPILIPVYQWRNPIVYLGVTLWASTLGFILFSRKKLSRISYA